MSDFDAAFLCAVNVFKSMFIYFNHFFAGNIKFTIKTYTRQNGVKMFMYIRFDIHFLSQRIAITEVVDEQPCVTVYDLNSKEQMVSFKKERMCLGAKFSPDGTMLALKGIYGSIFLYDFSTDRMSTVCNEDEMDGSDCQWAGNALIFKGIRRSQEADDGGGIYVHELNGKDSIRLSEPQECYDISPECSPCGRWVTYHRKNGHVVPATKFIHLIDLQTKESFELNLGTGSNFEALSNGFAPDSSEFLVIERKRKLPSCY